MYRKMYNQYMPHGNAILPLPPNMTSSYGQQPFSMMKGNLGLPRTQAYPYANPIPFSNYASFPEMNPYFHQEPTGVQQHLFQPQQEGASVQHVFQNPLQPTTEQYLSQQPITAFPMPYMNPYPKGSFMAKQPSGMKNILNSFKAQDGSLDINKMVDTAGQMINAVSQVSSVVKGFGGLFKA